MRILIIDTAGFTGGVVLAQSEDADPQHLQIIGASELQPREFSTQLIPAMAGLLDSQQCSLATLDGFAVVSGPGSFTGLRVGLSAVKALAEATAKPIVALSRLAVMSSIVDTPKADSVHAVLDAGRREFYYGLYRDQGWVGEIECLQTLEELTARLANTPGRIVASEPAVWDALSQFAVQQIAHAGARESLPLVWRSWQAGRLQDTATLDANYLRRSDAEILTRLTNTKQLIAKLTTEIESKT